MFEDQVDISDDDLSITSYKSQSFIEFDLLLNFCGLELNVISLKKPIKLQ